MAENPNQSRKYNVVLAGQNQFQCLHTLTEHSANIVSAAISPDCQLLASGDEYGEIRLWNLNSGKLIRILEGYSVRARCVAINPDGQTFVNSFLHNKSALFFSLAFSPDGQILASGGTDMTINLWNPHTGERLDILEDWDYAIFSIAFSPDGQTLAGGNTDGGKMRFWNLDSGELLPSLDGSLEDVSSIAFSPDGQIIAGGGRYDGKIKLWNLSTGELLRTLNEYSGWVQCLTFSPDGQLLVSGGWDETIIWNATTGELLSTLEPHSGCVMCIAFSSDGKILVVESSDNIIKVWRVMINNPNQPRPYDAVLGNQNSSPLDAVVLGGLEGVKRRLASESVEQRIAALKEALKYPQEGVNLVIQALKNESGQVHWAASSLLRQRAEPNVKQVLREYQRYPLFECLRTLIGHSNRVLSVAISADGQTLASGSADQTIKLWNLRTGELLHTLTEHSCWVASVAISADGQTLASGSFDKTVNLWNLPTGKLLHTIEGHLDAVMSVAISMDSQTLAIGADQIELWNLRTGELLHTLKSADYVVSVAFSPDEQMLASNCDNTIKLWNPYTGQLLRTFAGHSSEVNSVAFSSDGQTLASGSHDTTIKLWNPFTGELIRTLTGHSDDVRSVTFSPDGQLLASGSFEALNLWHVDTGELLCTLNETQAVSCVAISPNGQLIGSGSGNGTIEVWSVC